MVRMDRSRPISVAIALADLFCPVFPVVHPTLAAKRSLMNSQLHCQIRTGVTLIEVLFVIILLAAASVSGLMLFDNQWVARQAAKSATIDTAKALTTARNTSINSQATVRVTRGTFNGRQQLLIVEDPGPFRAGNAWEIDLGTAANITGTPATIQFSSDGSADQRLSWKISQQSVAGEVHVEPVGGFVSRTLP